MKLGWIGLGDMGQVIIPRLLDAGHDVGGLESDEVQGRFLDRTGHDLG